MEHYAYGRPTIVQRGLWEDMIGSYPIDFFLINPDQTDEYDSSYLTTASVRAGRLRQHDSKDCATIWDVWTPSPFRRQGFCTLLLQHVIQECSERFQTLYVQVDVSNVKAIALYQKLGFVFSVLTPEWLLGTLTF